MKPRKIDQDLARVGRLLARRAELRLLIRSIDREILSITDSHLAGQKRRKTTNPKTS